MTGEEAVRELRKAGRDDLFIIGATGNALKSDQESYMKVRPARRPVTSVSRACEQVLTSFLVPRPRTRRHQAGLNNILCKPISIKDIKAALEEAKRRRLKAA